MPIPLSFWRIPSGRQTARRVLPTLALLLAIASAISAAASSDDRESSQRYATSYGHGLDKWATAWLLTRQIDPDSQLTVVEHGEAPPEGAIVFDVPGAPYVRTGQQSVYTAVLEAQDEATPMQRRLAGIVHQIEVAYWEASSTPEALSIEQAFRRLQRGQDDLPADCYLRFLDSVAAALRTSQPGDALPADRLLATCTGSRGADGTDGPSPQVRELPIKMVLDRMGKGDDVVFIDVRESEEFAETRIPTAINVPIRALDESVVEQIADADLVVSYCVKDFRGYEMARLLSRAGVEQSAILNPFGLKGWIHRGLPVSGREALPEEQAVAMLRDCVATDSCTEVDR